MSATSPDCAGSVNTGVRISITSSTSCLLSIVPFSGRQALARKQQANSYLEWIRQRHLLACLPSSALDRFDRARFIEIEHRVELLCEPCIKIVSRALTLRSLGMIDRTDGPLRFQVTQNLR